MITSVKMSLLSSLFLVVALLVPLVVYAAPIFVQLEAETGAKLGDARSISDSTASGGLALSFSPSSMPTAEWRKINLPFDPAYDSPHNFGLHAMAQAKGNPNVYYLGTSGQGLWRTSDSGETWTQASNLLDGREGDTCARLDSGRIWSIAVDPANADVVYAVPGYSCWGRIWKSVNGGRNWTMAVPDSVINQTSGGIARVEIDPFNRNHIIVTSYGEWVNGGIGYLESNDAGATWQQRRVDFMGDAIRTIVFLNDSNSMMIGSEAAGFYRSTDGGATWNRTNVQGGNGHRTSFIYRSSNGKLYLTTAEGIQRSSDNGANWTLIKSPWCNNYLSIAGDGQHMLTGIAQAGDASCNAYYEIASESNDTSWSRYGTGTVGNGPNEMFYNPLDKTILSANWKAGVWKLQL